MLIRKLFRFEGAHRVRNGVSERCRENVHGHSYTVEVFIASDKLDEAGMVMDFALLESMREFVDSFDHTYTLWCGEEEEFKGFVRRYNQRVAEIPVPPTAEGFALLFLRAADHLLSRTGFRNGERQVRVSSVRVHETATGYAEAFAEDMPLARFSVGDIRFSEAVREAWKSLSL